MGDIEREDTRTWRLSGDPVRVDIGPPIFPGCTVDAVPVNELRRVRRQLEGAVVLSDDERKALAWAARHGAHALRSEGWADMKRNAEILDGILPRLEGGQ